jgi:bacteriocin-like protein
MSDVLERDVLPLSESELASIEGGMRILQPIGCIPQPSIPLPVPLPIPTIPDFGASWSA